MTKARIYLYSIFILLLCLDLTHLNSNNLTAQPRVKNAEPVSPSASDIIGSYDTAGIARSVCVDGDIVYIADDTNGLLVMNISDPSNPQFLGKYVTAGGAFDVCVRGTIVYIASGYSGLEMINVSNPKNPVLISNYVYDGANFAQSVFVIGNVVYMAYGHRGLVVINASKPWSPTVISYYDTSGYARCVRVQGQIAYLADSTSGLTCFNISTGSIVYLGNYNTPDDCSGVYVQEEIAYVTDTLTGLLCLNITNPRSPQLLGTCDTVYADGVDVDGQVAFVADQNAGALAINVTNPKLPTLIQTYNTPDAARIVALSGNILFVADMNSGLQCIEIKSDIYPMFQQSYDTPDFASNVFVSGAIAYIADSVSGLICMNITNPTNPQLLSTYNTPGLAQNIYVHNLVAYVADGSTGLYCINVTNPRNPLLMGSYNTPDFACGIFAEGGIAYVADNATGLIILNIRNPASPILLGTYNTVGLATDVVVSGRVAYISDGNNGLVCVNVTNPYSPQLLGTYDTPGFVKSVCISGKTAFVADNDTGVFCINITNPSNPTLIKAYGTIGGVRDIIINGFLVYVLDALDRLVYLNMTNPYDPQILYTYARPHSIYGLFISGTMVYIAEGLNGLCSIRVSKYEWENLTEIIIPTPILNPIDSPNLNGTIHLSWNPIELIDCFYVYRCINEILELNASVIELGSTSFSNFNDTVKEDGNYYYAIRAFNATGFSNLSNSELVIVDLNEPLPTTFLPIYSPNNNGSIQLNWTTMVDVDNYTIYRYQSPIVEYNTSLTTIATVTDINFTDTINWDGIYYYCILCTNGTGISNLSNCESVTVDLPGPSSTVLDAIYSPNYNGSIHLFWSSVVLAENYTILRCSTYITEINETVSIQNVVSNTNYTDTIYTEGLFYYSIMVRNWNGNSSLCDCRWVTVDLPGPPTPIISNPTSPNTNGRITISWAISAFASSYKVYRSITNITLEETTVYEIGTTPSTSYLDVVSSEGRYFYVVIAVNATGISNESRCVSTYVDFLGPSTPALSLITTPNLTGNIFLNWSSVTTATSYLLYRAPNFISNLADNTTLISTQSTTTFNDTVFAEGYYYYVVVASNPNGTSSMSTCRSVFVDLVSKCNPVLTTTSTAITSKSSILLKWNYIAQVKSYKIYRSYSYISNISSKLTLVATVNGSVLSYNASLTPDHTYYFVVCAVTDSGDCISNCIQVTVTNDEAGSKSEEIIAQIARILVVICLAFVGIIAILTKISKKSRGNLL